MFELGWLRFLIPMFCWTSTLDTSTPLGDSASHPPSQGDDRIREVKAGFQERLNIDHYFPLTGTAMSHADTGMHRKVTLLVQASAPTQKASAIIVYGKDVSGKCELFARDEDGDEIQITDGGVLKGLFPSGGIIMWHGTIANIPSGYVVCDGNNSTPNLLAKMVRCVATAATNPGTTGGSDTLSGDTGSHTLTIAEMPAHHHQYDVPEYGGSGSEPATHNTIAHTTYNRNTDDTGGGGGHVHPVDGIACIPAYYALAFLMKS